MNKTFIGLALALLIVSERALATQVPSTTSWSTLYVPLEDSHLIVRGVVTGVSVERTTLGDFGMVPKSDRASTWPVDVAHIQFTISEVIKGQWLQDSIEFTLRGTGEVFRPGAEMIVCARRWVQGNRERYAVGAHLGLFNKSNGDSWSAIATDTHGTLPQDIDYDSLIARVQRASLPSVTAAADLIARGTIVGIRTEKRTIEDGRVGIMTWYRLRVSEVLKGRRSSDAIEFVVPGINGSYVPNWARLVPNGIAEGQEWYVFLRENEIGLYPFAGPNSLFLVEGDTLIYDMAVEYPVRARDLRRIVGAETSNEN